MDEDEVVWVGDETVRPVICTSWSEHSLERMLSYKQNICNVPGCNEPEYKHHMCQKHYEFYSNNPTTTRFMEEVQALEDNTAGWKLKLKVLYQSFIHHLLNIPMPLIKHFPLEHVFLGEFYSMRKSETINSERVQQVITDFDIPENENLSDMQRRLNILDLETSEIGPKEKYLLAKKDLPSKLPIFLSIIGTTLLFCFFKWFVAEDFNLRGVGLFQIEQLFGRYIPYLCALIVFIYLGLLIPSQYNYFLKRAYNMTLFKDVKANADLVNQVKFVKERKGRSRSYYATILGCTLGFSVLLFGTLLGHGSPIRWLSVMFCFALVLAVVPLLYSYNEMVLYFPVVEVLKRKRISIDLYNADYRGGLKKYHIFLYLTFLYNEGVAVVLITVYALLPISKWWIVLLIVLLLPRFNHAGWALFGWIRSLVDFYKEKKAERIRLMSMEGSAVNMNKMALLNKAHPVGIIRFLFFLIVMVLIPYIVNQLPKWSVLLEWTGL